MIAPGQEGLDRLYALVWPPKPDPQPSIPPSVALSLDDERVLDLAFRAANGEETARLYAGDPRGDHSAADLALLSRLAFYTQDANQLDRIFRRSGLYREKWERQDYRDRTIQRALNQRETYNPAHAQKPLEQPPTVHVTADTSTEARIAALEARLARAAEIIETQRLRIQTMELEAQAVRNSKLKQAAPTLVAIARKVNEIRGLQNTERRDEEGYCKMFVGDKGEEGSIAAEIGISGDSVSRYLDLGERAGLLKRKHTRELREVVDKKTGEIKTRYVPQVWVSYDGTLTQQLQRIAEYNPEAPERVVNKIYCKKHPEASVIRFTTYKCGECGDTLQRGAEVDPDPPEDEDQDTNPQLAGYNPLERGLDTYPQLAGRTSPQCFSQFGECLQPEHCTRLGRCRWCLSSQKVPSNNHEEAN